jgi:hypothetical protein
VVLTVKVEAAVPLAAGVTEIKLNPQATVAFTGAIAQVNATEELNPFRDATVIVEVVEFPATVVADVGEAVRLKSYTARVYAAVWVNAPEVPVTVTV